MLLLLEALVLLCRLLVLLLCLLVVHPHERVVAGLKGVDGRQGLHLNGLPVFLFGREEGGAENKRISPAIDHGRGHLEARVDGVVVQDGVVKYAVVFVKVFLRNVARGVN